ncbi:hypothetical protein BdWA1_002525 [Babesia duncani]|uniref:At4g15545-like C-terminal domain-containing protein n=1 Tax=Babesia duncani TaxID=323732 RepID=A0AAD9UNL7_9APIC|nr:hypothetical protein BdWA1_002525 [Babesia duncani]
MEYSSVDLSWLPSDADEQLALGFRIISNAYKTRITTLEAEIRATRAVASDKSDHLAAVQKKYSSLEVQLIESTQRGNQLAEENRNLVAAIKKLQRDNDRLESLKKAVLCSIQDDKSDCEADRRFYSTDDLLHSAAPRTMLEMNECVGPEVKFTKRDAHIITSAGTTPCANIAGTDRETIDGRQFFKNAKAKMPTDDFVSLVALVKRFNLQVQSREDTLVQAKRIINDERIYEEFRQLLA